MIVFLYIFFHLPYFSVTDIQIVGTANADVTAKLDALKGLSVFSTEVTRRVAQIQENDLSISSLSCSRGIPNALHCNISFRAPALFWKQGDKIYLVDDNGFIYGDSVGTAKAVVVEDKTPEPLSLGKTVASSDIVHSYNDIFTQLTNRGFIVSNLYIADTLYQVGAVITGNSATDVNWHPAKPVNFLLVTSYPINTQADILLATVKAKSDKITERVDVRVPGYVYTK